jgi:hypothetical protein
MLRCDRSLVLLTWLRKLSRLLSQPGFSFVDYFLVAHTVGIAASTDSA